MTPLQRMTPAIRSVTARFSFCGLLGITYATNALSQPASDEARPAVPLTQIVATHFQSQQAIGHPLSLFASEHSLSNRMAYRSQHLLAQMQRTTPYPAGYKAALTSQAAQKRWGVSEAIYGTLNSNHLYSNSAVIHPKPNAMYLVELELGFILASEHSEPFADLASFQRSIKSVIPVVEIPEIHFAGKPKPVDIIASNVGAFIVISGIVISGEPPFSAASLDGTGFSAHLACDGSSVEQRISLALDSAWQNAMHLANQVIEQGQTLHPEQLLLSGDLQPSPFRMTASRCIANFTHQNSPSITYTFSIEQDSPDSVK